MSSSFEGGRTFIDGLSIICCVFGVGVLPRGVTDAIDKYLNDYDSFGVGVDVQPVFQFSAQSVSLKKKVDRGETRRRLDHDIETLQGRQNPRHANEKCLVPREPLQPCEFDPSKMRHLDQDMPQAFCAGDAHSKHVFFVMIYKYDKFWLLIINWIDRWLHFENAKTRPGEVGMFFQHSQRRSHFWSLRRRRGWCCHGGSK